MHENFKKTGYAVVRKTLSADAVTLLATEFRMLKETQYHERNVSRSDTTAFADRQVPHCFGWYAPLCFESLMLVLQPRVEDVVGLRLLPCYSYARIMWKGASVAQHRDRASCQFSASVCVAGDEDCPYPIHIENYDGVAAAVDLAPGDMLVYHGTELTHWRDVYEGKEHIQAFLHFVDADGQNSVCKFDRRPALGLPLSTKR